jgi:4-hydroxy-tetrahydrodipicolinate synthase
MKGLFAAVVTPTTDDGRMDEAAFDHILEFLLSAGVHGVCIGGATGEYPHFQARERATLIRRAARQMPRNRALLVGIGAGSTRRVLKLGQVAIAAGSEALLLPAPMFYRYEQQDLRAFCTHVSRELAAPCLLYDLPDFTNGFAPATVLSLLREEQFIVGIKDSSGRQENIQTFVDERHGEAWTLIVGDDRLLARGLQAGWDGGISGVAGFCPELLTRLYQSAVAGRAEETARLHGLLEELIARIAVFPTPWGIRIGLGARGISTGPLPLPLTLQRRQQIEAFNGWFPGWLERL